MFSKFSVKLNKQRAFTLDRLCEIIKESYKPQAEVIFVEEIADFRKFVTDKDQPNEKGCEGRVLKDLQQISYQRQFRFKSTRGHEGVRKTEFHAKHLSSTPDWGSPVEFLNYIPTTQLWVAPQMPLKCANVNETKCGQGEEDDEQDPILAIQAVGTIALEKYHKAILGEGANYFSVEDKMWWLKCFDQQKDILQNHMGTAEWRSFWTWPNSVDRTIPLVQTREIVVEPEHADRIAGPQRIMYSGPRKATPVLGDFKDLEANNKYAMIAVAAGDGMPFWLAKVTRILTRQDAVPEHLKVTWYSTEAVAEDALDGKYYPEKSLNNVNKTLQGEICLRDTTVYAYNFCLLESKTLPVKTKRIIEEATKDVEE
jgi:hypothetical protein